MNNIINENFIIAICFTIFLYFAIKPIKKAILSSLENKIEEIKNRLAEAAEVKHQAQKLFDEASNKLKEFEMREKEILKNSKIAISKLIKEKEAEINLHLLRKKESAISIMENEANKIEKELNDKFLKKSISLVEQYLIQTHNNKSTDMELFQKFSKKI